MRDPQHPLHIVVAGYRSFGHRFIDVGFHYQTDCDVDRQARGRLTDFTTWTAVADTAADDTIVAAAAGQGQSVRGNIGGRDSDVFDDITYSVHEVQDTKGDFGSWLVYLREWGTGTVGYLPITTHGGSTAFANPTIAVLAALSGRPAVVATMFIPTEGAAPGEAGQLIYYTEYHHHASDPTPMPEKPSGAASTPAGSPARMKESVPRGTPNVTDDHPQHRRAAVSLLLAVERSTL